MVLLGAIDDFKELRLDCAAWVPEFSGYVTETTAVPFVRRWCRFLCSGFQLNEPSRARPRTVRAAGMIDVRRYFSAMWIQRIEQAVTQPQQNVFSLAAASVNAEVTLHESVHQWAVNSTPPPNVQVGHCLQQRYQQDGNFCHMRAPFYSLQHNAELGDGQADFHYEVDASGKVDSEYVHVRRHAEPFVK